MATATAISKAPKRSFRPPTERLRRWMPLFVAMLLSPFAGSLASADEWFIKIEGIKGESTHERLRDWTRLKSVSNIARRPAGGPASFSCDVTKAVDVSSPELLQSCAVGGRLRRATLAYVLSAPGATQFRITLENVLITALAQAGPGDSSDPLPTESLSLIFEKIEWSCLSMDDAGGNTGGLTAAFDTTSGEGRLKPRRPFHASIERQDGRSGVLVTMPVEAGHRYRIFSRANFNQGWSVLLEFSAAEDGDSSRFIPMTTPSLFLRVEEAD